LQSDNVHSLCKRLADVNNRIFKALDNADAAALSELTTEHKRIMHALASAGDCRDSGMLDIFKTLNNQVLGLDLKIREQRDEVREMLVTAKRKKQAAAVYTNDTRGRQSHRRPAPMNKNLYTR
jgi:hypothetical protein